MHLIEHLSTGKMRSEIAGQPLQTTLGQRFSGSLSLFRSATCVCLRNLIDECLHSTSAVSPLLKVTNAMFWCAAASMPQLFLSLVGFSAKAACSPHSFPSFGPRDCSAVRYCFVAATTVHRDRAACPSLFSLNTLFLLANRQRGRFFAKFKALYWSSEVPHYIANQMEMVNVCAPHGSTLIFF